MSLSGDSLNDVTRRFRKQQCKTLHITTGCNLVYIILKNYYSDLYGTALYGAA